MEDGDGDVVMGRTADVPTLPAQSASSSPPPSGNNKIESPSHPIQGVPSSSISAATTNGTSPINSQQQALPAERKSIKFSLALNNKKTPQQQKTAETANATSGTSATTPTTTTTNISKNAVKIRKLNSALATGDKERPITAPYKFASAASATTSAPPTIKVEGAAPSASAASAAVPLAGGEIENKTTHWFPATQVEQFINACNKAYLDHLSTSAGQDNRSPMQQITDTIFASTTKANAPLVPLSKPSSLDPLQVSLVVKLYDDKFSLEAPSQKSSDNAAQLPYNHATRDFLRAIASCRLVPDLLEEIQGVPCNFYDGCVAVELIDKRGESTTSNDGTKSEAKEKNKITSVFARKGKGIKRSRFGADSTTSSHHLLLLRPDAEALHRDLNQFIDNFDPEMDEMARLAVMQKVLTVTKPDICLDPSPFVCKVANALHVNRQKFNFRKRRKPRSLPQQYQHPYPEGVVDHAAAAGANMSNLYIQGSMKSRRNEHMLLNYIRQNKWQGKQKRPSIKTKKTKPAAPPASVDLTKTNAVSPLDIVKAVNAQNQNRNKPKTRLMAFVKADAVSNHVANKEIICRVEIRPMPNGKYEAFHLYENTDPSNPNAEKTFTKCTLGNKPAADHYAKVFRDVYARECKAMIVFDREMVQAQPAATPGAQGTSAPAAPTGGAPGASVAQGGTPITAPMGVPAGPTAVPIAPPVAQPIIPSNMAPGVVMPAGIPTTVAVQQTPATGVAPGQPGQQQVTTTTTTTTTPNIINSAMLMNNPNLAASNNFTVTISNKNMMPGAAGGAPNLAGAPNAGASGAAGAGAPVGVGGAPHGYNPAQILGQLPPNPAQIPHAAMARIQQQLRASAAAQLGQQPGATGAASALAGLNPAAAARAAQMLQQVQQQQQQHQHQQPGGTMPNVVAPQQPQPQPPHQPQQPQNLPRHQ